jgi:hypothetical protein
LPIAQQFTAGKSNAKTNTVRETDG